MRGGCRMSWAWICLGKILAGNLVSFESMKKLELNVGPSPKSNQKKKKSNPIIPKQIDEIEVILEILNHHKLKG